MTKLPLTLVSALVLVSAACSDDPVSYSEPVGLKLSVASGDVKEGAVADEKNINTETGNPYAAFVAAAEDAVGGRPSRIAVEASTLALDTTSAGVERLSGIFAGNVAVGFVMNGSDTVHTVATGTIVADAAAGPVALDVAFDSDDMIAADYADLVGGAFKATLSGDAAPDFDKASADANLSLVLTFTAYE